jgi:hypothetical protein
MVLKSDFKAKEIPEIRGSANAFFDTTTGLH